MTLSVYPSAVRGLTWPVMKSHEFDTTVQSSPNRFETRILNTQNPVWHFTLMYEYLKDNPTDIVTALSPFTDYRYLEGFLLSNQGQLAEFLFDDFTDDAIGMNPVPGGTATYPSIFRPSVYPTSGWYYPLNSYVLDNNSTPHLQKVIQAGFSGSTFPAFNTSGGQTTSGGVIFSDQGVFGGANAQQIPLVNDGAGNYYSPIQRNFAGQFYEDVTDLNTTNYVLYIWANGVLQASPANYTLHTGGLAIPGSSFQGDYISWAAQPTGPITCAAQFYFRVRLESDDQDIEEFLASLWTIGGASSKNGSGTLKLMTSRVPTT